MKEVIHFTREPSNIVLLNSQTAFYILIFIPIEKYCTQPSAGKLFLQLVATDAENPSPAKKLRISDNKVLIHK